MPVTLNQLDAISLVPDLPQFYLCLRLREWKTGERQGSLGAFITWMTSGWHEVDVGGEGLNCQNYAQDHPFECFTAFSDSRPWHDGNYSSWPVRNLLSSLVHIILNIGPSPLRPPHVYSRDECSQAFLVLIFCRSSNSVYYYERKWNVKTG